MRNGALIQAGVGQCPGPRQGQTSLHESPSRWLGRKTGALESMGQLWGGEGTGLCFLNQRVQGHPLSPLQGLRAWAQAESFSSPLLPPDRWGWTSASEPGSLKPLLPGSALSWGPLGFPSPFTT